MAYTVRLGSSAQRQLDKLTPQVQEQVQVALARLADDPRHPGVIKMRGRDELYRARTGDYRIVYAIQDQALLVLVVQIAHRRDVYR